MVLHDMYEQRNTSSSVLQICFDWSFNLLMLLTPLDKMHNILNWTLKCDEVKYKLRAYL